MIGAVLALLAGWTSLFDGRSLDGWMWSRAADPPTPSWTAEHGMLRTTPERGERVYLLTRDSFTDFELEFEWKLEPGGNSGIKYRFQMYGDGSRRIEPVGLEYQIADDEGNPDAAGDPKHSTGAIYEYVAPNKRGPAKAGVWHTGRIVVRGLHIEHWLDGEKVVDVNLDAPEVRAGFHSSRRRSAPMLNRQDKRDSPFALQFHDGAVWFRSLRLRRL